METIFRKGIYKIMELFYLNRNVAIHLREIARRTGMNENSVSRFLNELVKSKILVSKKEDGVRKLYFSSKNVSPIFSIFDSERFEKLSFVRRKAIFDYIDGVKEKPICLILFGSSAKGQAKSDSDIDLLEINDSTEKNSVLIKSIEAQRGVKLSVIRLSQRDFNRAIMDKDLVILSAIKSGFPVFGKDFFYEVIINE